MADDLLYLVALNDVPNVGAAPVKILLDLFGSAEAVFKAPRKDLERIEGIGEIKARCIKEYSSFKAAEDELLFIENHHIRVLSQKDAGYPKKLLRCPDAPSYSSIKAMQTLTLQGW